MSEVTGVIRRGSSRSPVDYNLEGAPVTVIKYIGNDLDGPIDVMLEEDYNGYERGDIVRIQADELERHE